MAIRPPQIIRHRILDLASYIGLRFLRAPRRTRSISVVTWISGLGVMLGVTALIVVISVMNGFRENMFLAITGTQPNARVVAGDTGLSPARVGALRSRLESLPQVKSAAPYLSRQGFLRVGDEVRAIILRGVEPRTEQRVTELERFIRPSRPAEEGNGLPVPPRKVLAALRHPPPRGERSGILLGRPLAAALNLAAGDEVDVISTERRMTPIGPVPLIKRFRVAGIFETGLGNIDEVTAYVGLGIAQKLYRLGRSVDGLALRLSDPQRIDLESLRKAAGKHRVITWSEENRHIFQVMQLEKIGVFLVLVLIIVVAFFNIISSLIMLVLEKRKAIATLKSMGAPDGLIRRIFFMQGVWIGLAGTLGGLSLGLAACWALATFDILPLPPGVFPTANRLPVRVEWDDLLLITGSSFLICLLVTLYPATDAARTRPVENLRHE